MRSRVSTPLCAARERAGAELPAPSGRVGFVALGCPKAMWDAERILTRLRAEGYRLSPSYADADLVIVNTCGFLDEAVRESLDAIGEALAENGRVIVTGCLGARSALVRRRHPQVLAVTGPHAPEEVMRAVHEHLPPPHPPRASRVPPQGLRLTPRHYAYVKIAEGCNHRCTFCVIPQLRGPLVSRPIGEVMREAESLVAAGVKELILVAQDTSAYGVDLRHRTGFWGGRRLKTRIAALAHALGGLGVWVRLHYVYPDRHVDELVALMAEGRLVPYLDVPLQHAVPRILKLMKRPARAADMLARIRRWREICPEIAIRSSFIVGFPGETEADFEELLGFVEAAELDRVGCFTYSPVAGAPANRLPGQVPESVKAERRARLMVLQEGLSRRRLQRRIGSTVRVLVDEATAQGLIARSSAEAPEVDGVVRVAPAAGLRPGEFATVRVTGADAHDLFAEAA